MSWEIKQGDCRQVMAMMAAESIDAIVSDPPYGLSFMGKGWDHGVPGVEFWTEALRVAKPGAHLLAFGGTRTYHRLACAIEDAGWEIRDCVMWVYGSGFPKSHDVSRAIDKAAGADRTEIVGSKLGRPGMAKDGSNQRSGFDAAFGEGEGIPMDHNVYAPATDAARQWQGWGTALKPAWEPIIVARKPLVGTVAENVLAHGTGVLNIDGCRVEGVPPSVPNPMFNSPTGRIYGMKTGQGRNGKMSQATGRWPANFIHDGSDEVVGLFPQTGVSKGTAQFKTHTTYQWSKSHADATAEPQYGTEIGYGDFGSAARFFYCAKASKADRDEGCEGLVAGRGGALNMRTDSHSQANGMDTGPRRNHHPTVKPTALMRYLCRLVTPPGGVVLDPFTGSGSTGKAAVIEGFRFVGIEREPEYAEIAAARVRHADENKESYRSGGKCGRRVSGGSRYASSVISAAGNIGNDITESGSGCRFYGGQSSEELHAKAALRQMELNFS